MTVVMCSMYLGSSGVIAMNSSNDSGLLNLVLRASVSNPNVNDDTKKRGKGSDDEDKYRVDSEVVQCSKEYLRRRGGTSNASVL